MFVVGRSQFWKSQRVSFSNQQTAPASPWSDALLLFAVCFILHVAGTWALPLCDRDEPRFAEATREMRQRADWIVPWFNNNPRYDKPPLVYWLQASAYRMFGENEFSARLPSVLSSVLTSLAIYGFGRRMLGRVGGIWAALLFATCLQTFAHSKLAVADMLMILFFTTASWCTWELTRNNPDGSRPRWWWALVASLALAFLAKGPVGLLPILFPFCAAIIMRAPSPRKRIRPALVLLLVLAVIACWGVPALMQTGGDFWDVGMGKHVFKRSVGVLDGHGGGTLLKYISTIPLYFVLVFGSFFPWSIWLVWLVRRLWQRRQALGPDEAFLAGGTLIVFGIFSLVRTKLPHYTLPVFPFLCLLLVREWQMSGSSLRWPRRAAAVMTAAMLTVSLLLLPVVARHFPSYQLAKQCTPWLQPEMELASASYNEASLCWYFRAHIRGFHTSLETAALVEFMNKPGPRVCVLPTAQVGETFTTLPEEWKRTEVRGFNLGKGKWVELTALVKQDPSAK
jgi:4-amino-4-deoxy-L-arabinose transferase-like glycosyltransferase